MASHAMRYAGPYDYWTPSSQQQSHNSSDRFRLTGQCGSMHASGPQVGLSFSDASSNSSRKRARSERSSNRCESIYQFDKPGTWKNLHASDIAFGESSPASLTNSTYRKPHGFAISARDNPTFSEFEGTDSDKGFSRQWRSKSIDNGKQTIKLGAIHTKGGGRKRARTSSGATQQGQSWGSYVYNMIGGIAGRMMSLVSVAAFTGFTAGGGQGYEMTASGPRKVDYSQSRCIGARQGDELRPTLPGQYPEEEFDDGLEEVEEMRSAKRQQTSAGNDWVVVDAHSRQQPRSSPSNYPHSAAPRRPASRVSVRPVQPRRPRMSTGRVTSVSYTGSPQVTNEHRRSASFVDPRSPSSAQGQPPKATLGADLQSYSAKKQREVRQSDASMSRLNSQLQAMIKQGKQALASTIEVQDHGDEEDDGELVYEGLEGTCL